MLVLKNKQEYLIEAIGKGLPDEVLRYMAQGADVNAKGNDGDTPLLIAVEKGLKDVVKLLIAQGADANGAGRYNEAPLHRAALLGRRDMVELLIGEGRMAAPEGLIELAPLDVAAARRKKARPARGKADVDARTESDATPLHYAARRGDKDIAELLLAEGADVNARDDFGHTPLHYAAQAPINRSAAAVELILYQRAVKTTYWGGRSGEAWAHIERFKRSGAREHFEESAIIREISLRLIEKVAARPGSGEVLSRVRLIMEQSRDNYDPLLDDSAEDTSSRSSYGKTIALIDRLMKS